MIGKYKTIDNNTFEITEEEILKDKKKVKAYYATNQKTGGKFLIEKSFIQHLIDFKSWQIL